jgi:hypothetical protein
MVLFAADESCGQKAKYRVGEKQGGKFISHRSLPFTGPGKFSR